MPASLRPPRAGLRPQYVATISGIPVGQRQLGRRDFRQGVHRGGQRHDGGPARFADRRPGHRRFAWDISGGQPVPTSYAATIIDRRHIDEVRMALAGGNVTDYTVEPPLPADSRPHPGYATPIATA